MVHIDSLGGGGVSFGANETTDHRSVDGIRVGDPMPVDHTPVGFQPAWQSSPVLRTIDSHTGGEPTRVIVSGLPELTGSTVRELRDELATAHDWVRTTTVFEPRGHSDMFVAALTPRHAPDCVAGVVFMSASGYPDMCGHATIGVATTLVEAGLIANPAEPFRIDTPGGPITISATVIDGRVREITFRNRPAFYAGTVDVPTPGGGTTPVDIAYGGQWYAFVDAAAFGLDVAPEDIDQMRETARTIREALKRRLAQVGDTVGVDRVDNIVWTAAPRGSESHGRNVPFGSSGMFDRSPCGTATSARLAILHARGDLSIGEDFVNEGVLDTRFRGRIVEEAHFEGRKAVIPTVTGSAWLTGSSQLWCDSEDPLRHGFVV